MGIPIEVPGLNQFISEVPDGSIVSIEGGVDHPKAILASTIISTALEQGKNLVYVAPPGCGLMEQIPRWPEIQKRCQEQVDGRDVKSWARHLYQDSVVLVDSFSYLMAEKERGACLSVLESVRAQARKTGASVIMLTEDDLLPTELAVMRGYHSDGIIQFLARDSPDGVSRFIRITKWMTGASYDRNIYYNYTEGKINVDLRYRVV